MRAAALRRRRERLEALVRGLPGVDVTGGQHLKLAVGRRSFGYLLDDHHGDGILSLCCKAGPGAMEEFVELAPERYYVPAYLGARGWVALRVDLPDVSWEEVSALLEEAFRLVAPRRLAIQLEAGRSEPEPTAPEKKTRKKKTQWRKRQ